MIRTYRQIFANHALLWGVFVFFGVGFGLGTFFTLTPSVASAIGEIVGMGLASLGIGAVLAIPSAALEWAAERKRGDFEKDADK
jgi:hypothetical protein